MLTGVHFLLSLNCNYECDHCFLYCGPHASGTFTAAQLDDVFAQMAKVDSINSVYFEGGEAFLYYPIMLHGLRLSAARGYKRGIVTNGYWANGEKDAELWLAPLAEIGLDNLSVSDDSFHHGEAEGTRSRRIEKAARTLGLPMGTICLEKPTTVYAEQDGEKGEPIVGGDIRFRGRAADTLTDGLPTRPCNSFTECPDEDLKDPGRVHIDAFGNVHLCQGLIMGNIWETPLDELLAGYDWQAHPIVKPLVDGGPVELARTFDTERAEEFVDACQLCYITRKQLLDRFPQYLAPRSVYGEE